MLQIQEKYPESVNGLEFTTESFANHMSEFCYDESRRLPTINTHKGLYILNRLPPVIKSASGAFQKIMNTILADLRGIAAYLDDIAVYGLIQFDHLLKIYSFTENQIEYLGDVIDSSGICPGLINIEEIKSMPPPQNMSQFQEFLGAINYYGLTRSYSKSKKTKLLPVQVTVLGADTDLGEPTCFLLKQNPLVTVLRMQGVGGVKGMAVDLNGMDTRCRTRAYAGVERIPDSLKGTDIVLAMGINSCTTDFSMIDVLMAEGKRLKSLIQEILEHAPKAMTVICVPPVSLCLPIAALLFKQTHWYHPARLLGFAGFPQMEANTLLGRYQNLDPNSVHVPILGGPERDTAVPIFSRAIPAAVRVKDCHKLLAAFRRVRLDEFPKKRMCKSFIPEAHSLAEAAALNRLVTAMCLGMCGDQTAICSASIRANVIPTCKHFVSDLKFAKGGVFHNFGIPKLIDLELKLVERAAIMLNEREKLAEEFVKYTETAKEKEVPPFKLEEKKLKEKEKVGVAR